MIVVFSDREKSCMKNISVIDVLSNIAVLNKNLNK